VPVAVGLGPHLIVFAAATLATVTGYGFVVLSAPLLVFVMPPAEVVPLALGLGLVLVTALLARPSVGRSVDVGQALRLSAAGVLGIPIGAALLDVLAQDTLRVVLGAAVALSALGHLIARRRGRDLAPPGARSMTGRAGIYAAGFVAGILSGCVGLNGPPVALFLAWRGADKERLRATSAAAVWLLSAITLAFLTVSSRMPADLAPGAFVLAPALAVGWMAGSLIFQTIPPPWFSQLSLVFAATVGVITALVGLHR
jgi:uncharacterized protein